MTEKLELSILRNLLCNEEYFRKVVPFIKGEYFQEQSERVLFEEIQDFYNTSIPININGVEHNYPFGKIKFFSLFSKPDWACVNNSSSELLFLLKLRLGKIGFVFFGLKLNFLGKL